MSKAAAAAFLLSALLILSLGASPARAQSTPTQAAQGGIEDAGDVGAGILDVHVTGSDALVDRLGLQEADQVLEVAVGASPEEPAVVDRVVGAFRSP